MEVGFETDVVRLGTGGFIIVRPSELPSVLTRNFDQKVLYLVVTN